MLLICCGTESNGEENMTETPMDSSNLDEASVTNVTFSGSENAYTFSVTVSSPDTGCEQYADWWEVVDTQGNLIYRRILAHSHVNEQPFTRSGGPVSIQRETEIYIRAHMNNSGFGTSMLKGSVADGFTPITLADFAQDLESEAPQPNGCAF